MPDLKPCPKCRQPVAIRGQVECMVEHQMGVAIVRGHGHRSCPHPIHAAAQRVVEAAVRCEAEKFRGMMNLDMTNPKWRELAKAEMQRQDPRIEYTAAVSALLKIQEEDDAE